MPEKLVWDLPAERLYEYGVHHGVLYVYDKENKTWKNGVVWNGLINITDSPEGADNNKLWADGILYASMRAAEEYGASVEAYMYPPEFAQCDGTATLAKGVYIGQQPRTPFCLCWQTDVGTAEEGDGAGYKIHIAYNLTASPTEQEHETINDSPDAGTFSWDMESTPIPVKNHKPTSKIVLDSRTVASAKLAEIEKKLYGDSTADAKLLTPDEILSIING